jgi:hypothetical protein
MSGSQELNRYNIGQPQSEQNTKPNTIASAATIVPVHAMTFITGTVQIANITPPVPGYHELTLVFTNAAPGALLTSGNIQRAGQPVQNVPLKAYYDPSTAKYWIGAVAA